MIYGCATHLNPRSDAIEFVDSIGFDLLGNQLGDDVELALKSSLAAGAVFSFGTDPLSIFRDTVQKSIRDIEADKRGQLFQRFLRDGPYERDGETPPELRDKRLSNEETAEAITFIYSFMVNSFKGAVTELLAAATCHQLMQDPQLSGMLPQSTRLYVGDTVMVQRKSGKGMLKSADLHILNIEDRNIGDPNVTVVGAVEVKSGRKSSEAMSKQLEKHILRAKQGLWILGVDFPKERTLIGSDDSGRVLRITVQPSDWKIPRAQWFEKMEKNDQLVIDTLEPPSSQDQIIRLDDVHWHISLRWSKEAIAEAAYEMTFWYMEKVGEVIFKTDMPEAWTGMTPAEAGRNAVKMMLYYALLRIRPRSNEESRAIALYNTYCFGYALGMNFRNKKGRREMLWFEDLHEIAKNGCNRDGCRIVGL
jgi:hypothetical protein